MTRSEAHENGSDRTLVERARAGDTTAFAGLVSRYQAVVFAYAFARLHDFQLAEDATQETFLGCHRSLHKLRQPEALPAFLHTITRRVSGQFIRQRDQDESRLQIYSHGLDRAAEIHEMLERREMELAALAALRRLRAPLREVLVLHYLQGCSHREIAAFLKIPVTMVNNRLHTARKSMKQETLNMVKSVFVRNPLSEDFAEQIGRIIAVHGGLVDVQVENGVPRKLHDVLISPGGEHRLVVTQRRTGGRLRCVPISSEALEAGLPVAAADEGNYSCIPDDELAELIEDLAPQRDETPVLLETGIKSIDLLCPLREGGRLAIPATLGSGGMVLIEELCRRLNQRKAERILLSIFTFPAQPMADGMQAARSRGDTFVSDYAEGNTDLPPILSQ